MRTRLRGFTAEAARFATERPPVNSKFGFSRLKSIPFGAAVSTRFEQFRKPPLPSSFLLGFQKYRNDLFLFEHRHGSGRIVHYVAPRGQAAELGGELLAFPTEQKICRKARGIGVGG